MEQVSLFAASTPSKFTVHGARYIPKRTYAWQTLDPTRPPHPQPTIIPSSDGERFTVLTEEDPFFTASPAAIGPSPKSSKDVLLPQIRVSSSQLGPTPEENADHNVEHAELPKPFRRSMFDILKLKGPYRLVPNVRKEYTDLTPEEEPAEKTSTDGVRRVSSLKTTVAGERRPGSARLSLVTDVDTNDTEGLLSWQSEKQDLANASQQALRLKKSTVSSQSEKMKKPRNVTPFASESKGSPQEAIFSGDTSTNLREDEVKEENDPDIYTKAPQRHRSRTSHENSGLSRRSSAPDAHTSVLPLSPPSLMSPPLEKSLFFTSSLSSSVSLASCMDTIAGPHSSSLQGVNASPELFLFPLPSGKTRETKKLRTKRPEPPLPYPSYPDHVPARPIPRPRGDSASAKPNQRSMSPGSPRPEGRSTSAAYREGTTSVWSLGSLSQTSLAIALASSSSSSDMLNKVNDIVAQGYYKKRRSMGGGDDEGAAGLIESV